MRDTFPQKNTAIEVRLHGDDTWYNAVALDRPRKMWAKLLNYGKDFIADEGSIAEWRYTPDLTDTP